MSVVWFIAGFVLCLLMPASIQMVIKNIVSRIYNIIRGWIGKEEKSIKW